MCAATVGQKAPTFQTQLVTADDPTPRIVTSHDFARRWLILIFYPRDFSFVCPTELIAFSARIGDFLQRDCDVLGISVDTTELHAEWLATPVEDGGLGRLQFPLASDPDGHVAKDFGVWVEAKQVSCRGLFIIDPDGVLQYSVVHNLSVGRNAEEVLRVLDALRSGGLCPASWTRADGTLDAEAALHSGRVLGHYRIQDKLGEGSFGTVFAAWDLRLERMVALKILRDSLGESRESLLAEARTAAALNHPNVCTIYTVDIEDGLPLIAMEHIEGKTLETCIREGLDLPTTRRLAYRIATGMAAAHDHDIVHGDLKPTNIMVTDARTPKILDFGLAHLRSRHIKRERAAARVIVQTSSSTADGGDSLSATVELDGGMNSTRSLSGAIIGTPAYLSPEQAAGESGSMASDVFSLALTIFEMLTGQRAIQDDSINALLTHLQHNDLPELLVPQVEESFRPLLGKMLAHNPNARPSMNEVARQLAN